MKKRDRVMAALRGEPVDRVPLSFWLHNFTAENAVDSFVAETLRLAREFDWDYLKPQSRAQCFAEAGVHLPGLGRERHAVHAHAPPCAQRRRSGPPAAGESRRRARSASSWKACGASARRGGDPPIIWTVFSPMMVVPLLLAAASSRR
jgi:uroporphyrinogen decarboxylase